MSSCSRLFLYLSWFLIFTLNVSHSQKLVSSKKNSWEKISKELGPDRDEFRTFFYFRNSAKSKKNMKYTWNKDKDAKLTQLAVQYRGNWSRVAAEIDEHATKRVVIERLSFFFSKLF